MDKTIEGTLHVPGTTDTEVYKWIEDHPHINTPQIHIPSICYQTLPCQHDIIFKEDVYVSPALMKKLSKNYDKFIPKNTKLGYVDFITTCELLIELHIEIPEHFKYISDVPIFETPHWKYKDIDFNKLDKNSLNEIESVFAKFFYDEHTRNFPNNK